MTSQASVLLLCWAVREQKEEPVQGHKGGKAEESSNELLRTTARRRTQKRKLTEMQPVRGQHTQPTDKQGLRGLWCTLSRTRRSVWTPVVPYLSILARSNAWPLGSLILSGVLSGGGSGNSTPISSASLRRFASMRGLIAGC